MNGSLPNTRIAEAPAKVNLFLRVLGARPDGYHEIETLIAPISLEDRLEVHADADPSFRTLSLSLDERVDFEVLLPEPAVPQVLRQPGPEQVGRLDDVPVGGDNKVI